MNKLLEGLVAFRRGDFESHRDLFMNLKSEQKPHTLFIQILLPALFRASFLLSAILLI
jgi:hypothetical protein